jgi:predicted nucleotidyltransferase
MFNNLAVKRTKQDMAKPSNHEPTPRPTELARICQRFGLALLYIFGSRANEVRQWLDREKAGLEPKGSDVDVGVRPRIGRLRHIKERVGLAAALEDFLGCDRVDLVILSEADPFVAVEVIRGERLYAEDTHHADEYELYLLRRAGDLAPLERERMAMVLREDK